MQARASSSESDGEELVYREAWSTGKSAQPDSVQLPDGAAAELKAQGNAALEAGATAWFTLSPVTVPQALQSSG